MKTFNIKTLNMKALAIRLAKYLIYIIILSVLIMIFRYERDYCSDYFYNYKRIEWALFYSSFINLIVTSILKTDTPKIVQGINYIVACCLFYYLSADIIVYIFNQINLNYDTCLTIATIQSFCRSIVLISWFPSSYFVLKLNPNENNKIKEIPE